MRKSRLDLKDQTPLDAIDTIKRKKAEELEKLEVFGQRSDFKAKSWIKRDLEEKEKKEYIYFNESIETLRKFKKKIYYYRYLTTILLHFLKKEDIPAKYVLDVSLTDEGILIKIQGTRYYGAFKPCGVPFYDFAACRLKAVEVGNTIAKLDGWVSTSEGGIILPDAQDLKVYGRGNN